jgi:RNA polymerase sigma factor (sigma-70 family)
MDSLLNELMELDERLGKIVELRFFAGHSIEDTADILGISASTANRDWKKAKGWLYQQFKSK